MFVFSFFFFFNKKINMSDCYGVIVFQSEEKIHLKYSSSDEDIGTCNSSYSSLGKIAPA